MLEEFAFVESSCFWKIYQKAAHVYEDSTTAVDGGDVRK